MSNNLKNVGQSGMTSRHRNADIFAASLAADELDLICFSHLRWDFVYQRPQHLLSRFAKERRVFFVEEPVFDKGPARLDVSTRECGVTVVLPVFPENLTDQAEKDEVMEELLHQLFAEHKIRDYFFWYYTPMAMSFTRELQPQVTIYDCMDELALFKDAPPALKFCETELFRRSDLVFTGGQSLYEAKRKQHPKHLHIHPFPSSIDAAHFAQARKNTNDPADQAGIPHPRLGFFGVVDERLDLKLLDGLAQARPDWQLVIIGPVVKINPADLPLRPNIHYLGGKSYQELPAYLAGWDVAMLPFALNEATRFISPTKTPEYLAAGKPVVSTSIRDVVRPYGENNLVWIADTVEEFVKAVESAMNGQSAERREADRLKEVDAFLARTSWDKTWSGMDGLIKSAIERGSLKPSTAKHGDDVLKAELLAVG